MKCLLLLLVILWQSYDADSVDLIDKMSAKVNFFKDKLVDILKSLKNELRIFIMSHLNLESNENKFGGLDTKFKMQKTFNEFVENEAEKNDKESIYRTFRSEPTALMSTPQLATMHGKRMESHVVITKNGYLLTLHHLKDSNHKSEYVDNIDKLPNCTILLHHGLLGSSADWILLGPEKSLPYLLTRANCDVWLTNARGNYYSRGHISKKIDSKEFWNFTWQEMGHYDLPAVVDYIRNVKNSTEQISFIGHSMGATAFLAMLSFLPEYNKYFRIVILLAPLVFMINVKSPLRFLMSLAASPPDYLVKYLGDSEFIPDRKIPMWIASKYCKGPDFFCANPLLFLSGNMPTEDFWEENLITSILCHVPAGGSTNTLLHYAQMIKSGKFHQYRDESLEFSIKNVEVPTVLFSSSDDLLATMPDVLRLFFSIKCPIDHYVIREHNFGHTDFVWNPAADKLVFRKVVEFLGKNINCNASKFNQVK